MSPADAGAFRLPPRVRRLLLRLAPTVCPPEVEELDLAGAVVDHIELNLGSFPPSLRARSIAGLRAFGLVARLRGRHPGEQFERWWSSRRLVPRTLARALKALFALAYYEQRAVKDRIGYRPEEWIARTALRRLDLHAADIRRHEDAILRPDPLVPAKASPGEEGSISSARDWPAAGSRRPLDLDCDVVIVGSGAGGGVVAAELAEAGLDVIVLEEGGHHTTEEFTAESTAMVRMLYRDGGAAFARGRPPVLFAEGRCVGGSTVVNGGMSWRTPERILQRWSTEHGVDGVLPADMERYFERVERFLSARPQDEGSVGRDNELLREGAERMGWEVRRNLRAQVHCGGCNTCNYGCPTGAKQSVLVSYLPRAVRFGARVHADCRVDRILWDGTRAVGVSGRVVGLGGARSPAFRVRARATFVCAGAIETPALLDRSGVRSGRVGRNLSLHPNAKVIAVFDEAVDGFKGAHQGYQVREFADEGIVMAAVNLPPGVVAATRPSFGAAMGRAMLDYNHFVTAGVLVEDTTVGRVRTRGGRPVASYQINERDAAAIVRGIALLSELLFAAGARRIVLPFDGLPDLVGPDEARDLLGRRVPRASMELFTVHMMGTAAMGGDPERHVCDPFGRVRRTGGLYVSDASLLPTPVGVNPMETIMALATRNAERFLESI